MYQTIAWPTTAVRLSGRPRHTTHVFFLTSLVSTVLSLSPSLPSLPQYDLGSRRRRVFSVPPSVWPRVTGEGGAHMHKADQFVWGGCIERGTSQHASPAKMIVPLQSALEMATNLYLDKHSTLLFPNWHSITHTSNYSKGHWRQQHQWAYYHNISKMNNYWNQVYTHTYL